MAARAKIEYVHIGDGVRLNGYSHNIIRKVVGALAPISLTTTVLAAGSRPVVPAGDGQSPLYARVTALDNPIVAAWGSNPTATGSPATVTDGANMLRIQPGSTELFPVTAGDLISLVEVA